MDQVQSHQELVLPGCELPDRVFVEDLLVQTLSHGSILFFRVAFVGLDEAGAELFKLVQLFLG